MLCNNDIGGQKKDVQFTWAPKINLGKDRIQLPSAHSARCLLDWEQRESRLVNIFAGGRTNINFFFQSQFFQFEEDTVTILLFL